MILSPPTQIREAALGDGTLEAITRLAQTSTKRALADTLWSIHLGAKGMLKV